MSSLLNINLQNRFHSLGDHFYTECMPKALSNPTLVKFSPDVAEMIGIKREVIESDLFLQIFSCNQLLENSKPLAHDYAGHQLGKFNAFLGDGRSALLFDTESSNGFWEVNLKGIGQTAYSREFDGRSTLNVCIHEFELSERLRKLDVPTVHGLCVISSDEKLVSRGYQSAAMYSRVAPSFIRFGTFENYYFQKNNAALEQLTQYVIKHYYPECYSDNHYDYAQFFKGVVIKTAQLIAHWQANGFVHGMMNTDNQSILGITIDLGESSFTESHDSNYVSASSDEKGRYAFGQQPVIGLWNCNVLAKALSPIISQKELKYGLQTYEKEYLSSFENFNTKK